MAIQATTNRSMAKQRTGTSVALLVGSGFAAITMAVALVTWRDAAHGPAAATVVQPTASMGATREAPPIGGMAELYAEQEAVSKRAPDERIDTIGGMAELYREQQAGRSSRPIFEQQARGGLAELYAEQEAAHRTAAGEAGDN